MVSHVTVGEGKSIFRTLSILEKIKHCLLPNEQEDVINPPPGGWMTPGHHPGKTASLGP